MSFLQKAIDTAATVGRSANTYLAKPLRGICPNCNNLSPRDHIASSNNSLGFWDFSNDQDRKAMYDGAVWLILEPNIQDLIKTSRGYSKKIKPCVYCLCLIRGLQHYIPQWSEQGFMDDLDATITLILVEGQPIVVQTQDSDEYTTGFRLVAFEIGITHAAPSHLLPFCGSFAGRSIRSDTKDAWGFIGSCMKKCNTEHPNCDTSAPTRLPKRVLDIGSASDPMKLVETKLGDMGTYAALSHCWGTEHPVRTLKDNLQQRQKRIRPQKLNNTFKDAIEVTKRLGLRYIWIDSLCIVQDSREDWEEQAAQMATIYKHAYVTIATSSSPGPTTSIFAARDEIWKTWDLVIGSEENGEKVQVRRKILPMNDVNSRDSYAAADWVPRTARNASHSALNFTWYGPIYTRAWCFQEQLLSRRMIHYTPGAIIWECDSERQVEGENPVAKKPEDATAVEASDLARQWRNNIRNYSQRNITSSADRLVALSGVASDLEERTGDTYLAGLWKSSLFYDLLWHASPWVERPMPETSIAPSWSWASLGSPVVWNEHSPVTTIVIYAQVEGAETTIQSPINPYGDVSAGSITIRGPVVEATILFQENMSEFGVHVFGSWEKPTEGHFVLPDTRMYEADGLLENGETEKTYRRAIGGESSDRYMDDDGEQLEYVMKVTILCFLHTKALDVIGLVLGRSTTVPGAFVRLAPAWKLPKDYVKRAEVRRITIV